MANVQKKIQTLIKESYCIEEVKFDSEIINFFENEAKAAEEQSLYIHPKGITEDIMTAFYSNPQNTTKISNGDFAGSPFK